VGLSFLREDKLGVYLEAVRAAELEAVPISPAQRRGLEDLGGAIEAVEDPGQLQPGGCLQSTAGLHNFGAATALCRIGSYRLAPHVAIPDDHGCFDAAFRDVSETR
jgi:hypothetical protein